MGTDKSLEDLREETERTDRIRGQQPLPITHTVSDAAGLDLVDEDDDLVLSFVTDGEREVTVEFTGEARADVEEQLTE